MDFLYDTVLESLDETYVRFVFQWNMFDVQEDSGATEHEPYDDSVSLDQLLETGEDPESVTLIWREMVIRNERAIRRPGNTRLGETFRRRQAMLCGARQLL
jgi:hypothetical protein